jgi:N-acylneuraminate cytidylyltransferase
MAKIKLFVSDIDGTLTDGTIYYSKNGEEMKQFSHRDGRGFHLLKHETNVKSIWITSEHFESINFKRAEKLLNYKTLDEFYYNSIGKGKLNDIKKSCKKFNIKLKEVAFIGDDTNDLEALQAVGFKACPNDAVQKVKDIDNIYICENKGGQGAVREYIDFIMENELCELK